MTKVTQYGKGEHQPKRELRGAAAAVAPVAGKGGKGAKAAAGGGVADLLADMPRENISKKLTSKLYELFKHKDPKKRKEAADATDAIL